MVKDRQGKKFIFFLVALAFMLIYPVKVSAATAENNTYYSLDESTMGYDINEATTSWNVNSDGTVKGYWFEDDRHLEVQGSGYISSNINKDIDSAIIKSVNIGAGVKAAGQSTANSLFFQWYDLRSVTFEDADEFTKEVTDMNQMFGACYALETIDLSGFNTSNTTCMSYMFCDAKNLQSVDISGLDTSNVTSMSGMFWGCENLKSVYMKGINTSKVSDMGLMFCDCKKLSSIDLSGLDTSDVHDMWGMFEDCESLTDLDLSTWDTSSCVKYMAMFEDCKSLKTLDISGFDMAKDYDSSGTYMMEECEILEKLVTPKVGNTKVHLPKTMYDSNGDSYTRFPASSITLTASKPGIEGDASDSNGVNTNLDAIKKITTKNKQKVEIKTVLMDVYKKEYPDAIVKKTKFKSGNKKVAKVNKKGTVTGGKKSGEAIITMFVKTQYTITKSNGKTKNKLSKWTSAGSITVSNTGK